MCVCVYVCVCPPNPVPSNYQCPEQIYKTPLFLILLFLDAHRRLFSFCSQLHTRRRAANEQTNKQKKKRIHHRINTSVLHVILHLHIFLLFEYKSKAAQSCTPFHQKLHEEHLRRGKVRHLRAPSSSTTTFRYSRFPHRFQRSPGERTL